MKKLFAFTFGLSTLFTSAQTASDLFTSNEAPITYLGIDYSHVQLLGDFSQAFGYGEQNLQNLRDNYFPAWNNVIINERKKYDIAGMLRRDELLYDPKMIEVVNEEANLEALEVYNEKPYSKEEIAGFVSNYSFQSLDGIGVFFIAQSLNKTEKKAVFHFVAVNMTSGEILIQDQLIGAPRGIGIRNYWAGSVYDIIQQIKSKKYRKWKKECIK